MSAGWPVVRELVDHELEDRLELVQVHRRLPEIHPHETKCLHLQDLPAGPI